MTEKKDLGEKIKMDEGEIDLTEGTVEAKGLMQCFTLESCPDVNTVCAFICVSSCLHELNSLAKARVYIHFTAC